MSFCSRCGAYIPMEETACPACGYDPEAQRRAEEKKRAEEARRQAEEQRAREEAEEKARREREAAQERARRMEEQRKAEEARNRYRTSTRKGSYTASRSTSQRTGEGKTQQGQWQAPWEQESRGTYDPAGDYNRARARDSAANQKLSVLSYIGPLFIIPLLRRENDPFARFHANQGLVLFLFEAAVNLVSDMLGGLGWAVSLAGGIFAISCMIRGIRSVNAGRMDKLPWIGDINIIK